MKTYNPELDIRELADIEWHNQQERLKRADTTDYYSDFGKTEGRGILMNQANWICDDCQGYRHHPDRKWKSLNCNKDFHLGIWVCEKCVHRHGYEEVKPDCSVEYFNEAWELGIEKFDNCVWVLPQRAKQLSQYLSVIDDLETLRWIRAKEYGKRDERVNLLDQKRHQLTHEVNLYPVNLLSTKEKFALVFKRKDLYSNLLFIPQSIYQNKRYLPTNFAYIYPEGIV